MSDRQGSARDRRASGHTSGLSTPIPGSSLASTGATGELIAVKAGLEPATSGATILGSTLSQAVRYGWLPPTIPTEE